LGVEEEVAMRRRFALVSVFAIALLSFVTLGRGVVAQEATPVAGMSLAGHPLVGTWIIDGRPDDPSSVPALTVFSSDGTVIDLDSEGFDGAGAWEATGPRSALLIFVSVVVPEGFAGTSTIRAAVEVDETGASFAGEYNYTLVGADGTVLDSGPGSVLGTRITPEPVEAGGSPLKAIPTWIPEGAEAPAEAATPEPAAGDTTLWGDILYPPTKRRASG
jgi:hypothetical protein